jgi:hypothetical protein
MQQTREPQPILRLLPIGGLAAAVVGLMLDINYLEAVQGVMNRFIQQAGNSETCRGEINQSVIISRDQLAAFLTISERDAKPRVQEILQSPYCYLSNVEIRAGVQAERAVYPLAFDPKTRLVVLYEGEEYAGYQFQFVPN